MPESLAFGLIGAGWIGSFHGETLARKLPGVRLVAVADLDETAAQRLSAPRHYHDPMDLIADPSIDAVAICSPASTHTDLVVAAAAAGKHVFCEKPMALTLADADRAIDAAREAGVLLQVGFNRRFATDFADVRKRIDDGAIGTPQLLRSLTRDPGISADTAARVRPWTIFNETLIHDFDTLCWLNPGARVVSVYAQAAALIHPQFADAGSSIRPWSSCTSTTARSGWPRPASRPCTDTTSGVRSSGRAAYCWQAAHPLMPVRETPRCSPTPMWASSHTSPTAFGPDASRR